MSVNRALFENLYRSYSSVDKCIFLSHKKEDQDAAKKIGEYIMNNAGIDIYLDLNDGGLISAVSTDNHKSIVAHIERALIKSSDLLCIVSDRTNTSWWVPYEIGYAKSKSKGIASLKLKDILYVPSYLEIEEILNNKTQLDNYLTKISGKNFNKGYLNTLANYIQS